MRQKVAKRLRKALYGDQSARVRRYGTVQRTGQTVRMDLGRAYRNKKQAWNRMTRARKEALAHED